MCEKKNDKVVVEYKTPGQQDRDRMGNRIKLAVSHCESFSLGGQILLALSGLVLFPLLPVSVFFFDWVAEFFVKLTVEYTLEDPS